MYGVYLSQVFFHISYDDSTNCEAISSNNIASFCCRNVANFACNIALVSCSIDLQSLAKFAVNYVGHLYYVILKIVFLNFLAIC